MIVLVVWPRALYCGLVICIKINIVSGVGRGRGPQRQFVGKTVKCPKTSDHGCRVAGLSVTWHDPLRAYVVHKAEGSASAFSKSGLQKVNSLFRGPKTKNIYWAKKLFIRHTIVVESQTRSHWVICSRDVCPTVHQQLSCAISRTVWLVTW